MSEVRLRGGPFDGRVYDAQKKSVGLECGCDDQAIRIAVYERKAEDFVFSGYQQVYELVGGPLDGTFRPFDPAAAKPGAGFYLKLESGNLALYSPIGRGRYTFDTVLTAEQLRQAEAEAEAAAAKAGGGEEAGPCT